MADKEVLEMEVKSNIKGIAKDQKEWNKELKKTKENIEDVNEEGKEVVAEMQILGISVNGLKAAWTSAAKGAKFLFSSIKAGIASTGIGLLVLAFGSLSTWFTKTKKGAEALEVVFSGIGAAVGVIVDRFAKFGGGLAKLLTGDVKGGLEDMKTSFVDIGKEIKADTLLTLGLTRATQLLADSQRELNVETEKQRAEIERLKLIAEDVSKSQKERLTAAQDAFNIEKKLVDQRVVNAERDLDLQQQTMKLTAINGKNTAEELDREAELKMNVFRITQESTTKQIELNNKINAIIAEGKATELAALDAKKAADAERMGEITKMPAIVTEVNDKLIQADNEYLDSYLRSNEARKKSDEEVAADKVAVAQAMYSNLTSMLTSNLEAQGNRIESEYNKEIKLAEANGKSTEAIEEKYEGKRAQLAEKQKKLKIGLATVDMYQSVIAAYNQGMGVPPPAGLVLGPASAALALAAGLANINSIMQTDVGAGGGGGSMPNATIEGGPAPQMMSGAFELSGAETAPEAFRAFVVTDEMTSSQNQLANIRRRATI